MEEIKMLKELTKSEEEDCCWNWYTDASLQLVYEDFDAYVQHYIKSKTEQQ